MSQFSAESLISILALVGAVIVVSTLLSGFSPAGGFAGSGRIESAAGDIRIADLADRSYLESGAGAVHRCRFSESGRGQACW